KPNLFLVPRLVRGSVAVRSIRIPDSTRRRNFAPRPTMDPSNRISRAEIAEQLGVQTRTIAKWERTGRFPAPKEYVSDRVILYDRDEVYAVIESRLMHSQRVVGRLAIVHDDWLLHACGEVDVLPPNTAI